MMNDDLLNKPKENDTEAASPNFQPTGYFFQACSVNNLNIHGDAKSNEAQNEPTSIKRIRQPISLLVETNKYQEIYSKVSSRGIVIFQCSGIAGSGKSQIVRKLAKSFPFLSQDNHEKDKLIIKWHIQCKDSGHSVKQELQNLAKELHRNAYINSQEIYRSIADALESGSTESLIDNLEKLELNILIIVEDPVENNCIILLKDFFMNIEEKYGNKNDNCNLKKFHLYITSRNNSSILNKHEEKQINCYKREIVTGFDMDEAVNYLNNGVNCNEEQAAKEVYRRFGGLPFGLQTARRYCQDARIGYSEYLVLLQEMEYEIIDQEKKDIVDEYGKSAPHIFQAIVTPFSPAGSDDKEKILQYKILLCLSYFNYDRIPVYAICYCCYLVRKSKDKILHVRNKAEVGRLITKLEEHHMCSLTDKQEITFHEVIVNSFRLNQCSVLEPNFNPLKTAVEVMAGLVSKDTRKKENFQKMLRMRRHLQTLLGHVEKSGDSFYDSSDKLMLKALVSHLYETTVTIMLNESPALFWNETDSYYKKALNLIWKDGDKIIEEHLGQSPNEVAKLVIKVSKDNGDLLPKNFIVDYVSKLNITFDEDEIKFLKSQCSCRSESENFGKFEKHWKEKSPNKILIESLQNCGLFLSNQKYHPIFYAERIASVLHSWSRRILYADSDNVKKDVRSRRMTWLSNSICRECKNTWNISLLMERLSQTGGLIPIVLKQKNNENNDYEKVLYFCHRDLNTKDNMTEMYENGLRKEFYGPSHKSTSIVLLRSIVRVNTRLIDAKGGNFDRENGDKICNELLNLAIKHYPEISSCVMCIIYCAKYFAASKNIGMSMHCFDQFFRIYNSEQQMSFNLYCWGVHNYLRAVSCFDVSDERINDAISKYKDISTSKEAISSDLNRRFIEILKQIKESDKL